MAGSFTEIRIEKPKPLTELKKKEAKELLDKKWKEDSRLVKGVFKNLECPGGSLEFPYREYPQDPYMIYKMEDGGTYEVPLGVAKHINVRCNEKMHEHIVDANGKKTVDVVKGRQRYQFLSTEFM
jgi:hypothetical protein